MRAFLSRSVALLVALVPAAWGDQKAKPESVKPAPPEARALTEEDREILRNRELLENLELLQNFEQIRYLNFLSEKKATKAKEKQATKTPAKNNGSKNQR